VLRVALVFLADVFQQLVSGQQAMLGVNGERFGVRSAICDGNFFGEGSEIGAGVALYRVELLGVRMAYEVEPE